MVSLKLPKFTIKVGYKLIIAINHVQNAWLQNKSQAVQNLLGLANCKFKIKALSQLVTDI